MNSINFNEIDESNRFPALVQAVMQYLDFKKWGFSYEILHAKPAIDFSSKIVFRSELCKVKIHIFRDTRDSDAEVYFSYGRLHAPNEAALTTWNGEKCHCWHSMRDALNFLDGCTPEEAVANWKLPTFMNDFYETNKQRGWSPIEMTVRRQDAVWDQYGLSLFSLFDLRHPDLWQEYSIFYKKLYDIRTTYPDHSITPMYKIC